MLNPVKETKSVEPATIKTITTEPEQQPSVFDLDEETILPAAETSAPVNNNSLKDESDEDDDLELPSYRTKPVHVSADIFGTSLPISIPKFYCLLLVLTPCRRNAASYHPQSTLEMQKEKDNSKTTSKPPAKEDLVSFMCK